MERQPLPDSSTLIDASQQSHIITADDVVLVTGANGFIGSRVVSALLAAGFRKVRCLTRPTSSSKRLDDLKVEFGSARLDIVKGNLLSRETCASVARGVAVAYHLAAGIDKSFPGCFLNSVVTTRNLIEALLENRSFKRLVNTSSLAVYSNDAIPRGGVVDEATAIDSKLVERHDPYAYGKAEQDDIVRKYGLDRNLPYVIVRPGVTFGPGKARIPGRVGIDTFGIFLHLGLKNRLPLTYVDNCAEAIVLAGLKPGIEGEEINVIDDDLPTSRDFLRKYKRQVKKFASVPVPYRLYYLLNFAWERYSAWSEGQLPPAFNRRTCAAYFKGNTYSNKKAKELLGWRPRVGMNESLDRFYAYARHVTSQS
jgi:nucleoside-diphosphate-sugar epimerase